MRLCVLEYPYLLELFFTGSHKITKMSVILGACTIITIFVITTTAVHSYACTVYFNASIFNKKS